MSSSWPALPLESWQDTYATLHRYTQIVGKIQLALCPSVSHFWHVTFRMTARGITTPSIPYGDRTFEIAFDFIDHHLLIRASDGEIRVLELIPRSVAAFYREVIALLASLGIQVRIWDHPVEIPTDNIPFHSDERHAAYDPESVWRCWRILDRSAQVMEEFRGRFIGKSSPVHFFWGSFDLAVSRFSGRPAIKLPANDPITREAYSHEVSSVGFWPCDVRFPEPAYYAYTSPVPDGLAAAPVRPSAGFWHPKLGEFLLPYEAVRQAPSPRAILLEFFQSTYEAGADLAGWDRAALERREPSPGPQVAPPLPAHA